jgi:FlaA1/EpsC-like NDP-sugar epimerase
MLRVLAAVLHDLVAAGAAWYFAYALRFNLEISPAYLGGMLQTLPWVIPLQGLVFWQFGLYRGIWRYASLPDLERILVAVGVSAAATAAVAYAFFGGGIVPRSVLVLDPLLLLLMMGGSRMAYRVWREHRIYGTAQASGKPVLVVGAGDAAAMLLKELERSAEWRVVGLVDDDPAKQGRRMVGVKVLGKLAALPEVAKSAGADHAIIAMPSSSHTVRRRAAELCGTAGLKVLTVPSFDDLVSGKVTVSAIRRIELDDLLGRDAVELDSVGLQQLLGQSVVLVTGAGGSIGSELCRQIARFKPRLLVFLELNEFALYQIGQEFADHHPGIAIACAVGDVKDEARVEEVLGRYRPDIVFHAAAYKHVPLMEDANAWQAVRNNVLGTHVMAEAAARHGARKFILISTDKAVNPANVMGASKRLAEVVCQSLQQSAAMQFVIVRFGNVLGSAGSVIPRFREQIARGGPVTVTHPEIIRYFMSIEEAAQLVLQAGAMGKNGEIFVLDMGEPVKIADLARELIRLSGFTEDEIRIVYSGLRPGEKLYEELLADGEHTMQTPHPKLRIARARPVAAGICAEVLGWLGQRAGVPPDEVRRALRQWLPEYQGAASGEAAVSAAERRA